MLQSVVLNDNMRGMRFDKAYVDPTIDYLIVRSVLYPMILHDTRNIIIEDNQTKERKMILREVTGDLFTAPQGYYLAHCISGNYTLGAGIAKKFDEEYDMKFKLHRDYPIPNGEKFEKD